MAPNTSNVAECSLQANSNATSWPFAHMMLLEIDRSLL